MADIFRESRPGDPAISNDLMKALIKVFGLEGKRVTALTLSLRCNTFAKLEIERAPLVGEVREFCDAIIERGPGWEKSLVVVDKVVSPVDGDGKARPTSSRVYPGAEEIAIELAAKEGLFARQDAGKSESWRDRAMKDPTFTEPAV